MGMTQIYTSMQLQLLRTHMHTASLLTSLLDNIPVISGPTAAPVCVEAYYIIMYNMWYNACACQ